MGGGVQQGASGDDALRPRLWQIVGRLSASFIDLHAAEIDRGIEEALRTVGETLELDRAMVCLVSPDRERVDQAYQWSAPGTPSSADYWRTRGTAAFRFALDPLYAGETYVLHRRADLPGDQAAGRRAVEEYGTLSYLAVPFRVAGKVLGWVGFSANRAEHVWSPEEIAGLELVGQIVASAYDRKRVDAALQEKVAVLRLLATVSARFLELPVGEIDAGIEDALGAACRALRLDRAQLLVASRDGKRIEEVRQWCAPGVASTVQLWREVGLAPVENAWRRVAAGETWVLRSPSEIPEVDAELRRLVAGTGTRAYVACPLRAAATVHGWVGFGSTSDRDWSTQEVDELRLFAEVIGSAYERKVTQQALDERLAFERLLSELSARLVNTVPGTLDAVIEDALRSICGALRFDRVGVMLLSPDRRHVDINFEWSAPGVPSSPLGGRRGIAVAEFGWPMTRIAAGDTFVIRANDLPPATENARRVLDASGSLSIVNLPLRVGREVLGSLYFSHVKDASAPAPELVTRLGLVGEIVANALMHERAARNLRDAFDEITRLKARVEGERDYLREEVRVGHHFDEVLGRSPALERALGLASAVATTSSTVLLRGESGVGKELFARAIHARSPRADGPLVKVNCASIPESLFESEFFGHVRGSFTGAHRDRVGRFELADKGTLFLDEVGEIPIELQAKLLRVLQEGEFERIGDDRTRKVDVRVIAATNRDLERAIDEQRFRRDLYFRLSVFPILVPPLRERPDDIVPLAEHFLRRFAHAAGRSGLALTDAQRRELRDYDWPGNIRELQNVIERAVILSPAPPLRLAETLRRAPPPPPSIATSATVAAGPAPSERGLLTEAEVREFERENLLAALERAAWRVSGPGGAAELLGVRPSTLRDRMKAFGLRRDR